jgi:hypothetical protein
MMWQIPQWRALAGRVVPGLILVAALWADAACASSRIKDLASVEGVRENQLIGYGLVVGLNGTGDTSTTRRSPGNPSPPCWSASASTSAGRLSTSRTSPP